MFLALLSLLYAFRVLIINSYKTEAEKVNPQLLARVSLEEARNLSGEDDYSLTQISDLAQYFFQKPALVSEYRQQSLLLSGWPERWLSFNSEPIAVRPPVKILFNIDSQNTGAALTITSKMNKNTDDWWENIWRLYISYNKYIGLLKMELRDGIAESRSSVFEIQAPPDSRGSFIMIFGRNNENDLEIYTGKGLLLETIHLSELEKTDFGDGFFSSGVMYIGANVPPKKRLIIYKLAWYNET